MWTRVEEPEKLVPAEQCVWTGLLLVESLSPAQIPACFTASEGIIRTLPISPYLLLSPFLSIVTQKLPALPFFLFSWH